MSATSTIDGLGSAARTPARAGAGPGTPRSGRHRTRPFATPSRPTSARSATTSSVALAARPRAATPVFVDGGGRARWARRAGRLAGVALAAWITLAGLALVGPDRPGDLRVPSDRAVAVGPATDLTDVVGVAAARMPTAGPTARAPLFTADPGAAGVVDGADPATDADLSDPVAAAPPGALRRGPAPTTHASPDAQDRALPAPGTGPLTRRR